MSGIATAIDAVSIVRSLLLGEPVEPRESSTISGLHAPLGQEITVTVFPRPAFSSAHLDTRLELADLHRGDNDADLGIVIAPSGLAGIAPEDSEAWNVAMTLPTLLRILGQDTTQEGTPE